MNYNICTYYVYTHYNCSFENLDNMGILSKLKVETLRTYPSNGINVEVNALDGFAFQITNSLNQLISNDSAFSNINLGECENLLKDTYGINRNISLIFFKFENIESTANEREIQYEVYNPLTYEQLNLSICQDQKVTVTIRMELSDEIIELIQSILDQGYNPFDENDRFYREICTPYNSENGTDVLLDDREEYIYSTIANETSCPSGCEMKSYSLNSKYITCECDPGADLVALDLNHISAQNVMGSFLSTLKNSNYKVMICYNLVFNFKIFCHNYGSIITLIFFIIYVLFMIYYCCKGITPIKVSVSKLYFDEQKKEHINLNTMQSFNIKAKSEKSHKSSKSKKKKQNKSTKDFNPPKKSRAKRVNNNNSFEKKKQTSNLKLLDIVNKRRRSIKNKPHKNKDGESVKSDKVRTRKSIIDYQNEIILKTRENLLQMDQQKLESKEENAESVNPFSKIYKSKEEKSKKGKNKNKNKDKQETYDNYEYNHMDYLDASEYDKRTCLRTYWSVILREHYVLFTFLSRNDYNLFYVKIERFFILICTEMTMNGMFFLHETMYKKKTGGITFAQKLPQIIFSLIVTHIIEVMLCWLGMTDVHYYEIKALPKLEDLDENVTIDNFYKREKKEKGEKNKEKENKYKNFKNERDEKIFKILQRMERKLIGFFIFTFLVFLFHWYFISAFCAVYQNTQKIYLRDSGISILTSLIDPFIIYGITCILRAISLTLCCRKKLSCIYKLSDLIPIF